MHHFFSIEQLRRGGTHLLLLLDRSIPFGPRFLLALALLQKRLGDEDVVLGGDGPAVIARLVRSPAYRGMEKSAGGELLLKCDILCIG